MTDHPTLSQAPEQHAEGAKARVLAAALRLFCQKGYEATAVREIVNAAGVTKPVLYYYFTNKEDVFRSILTEALMDFRRRLVAACEASDYGFARQAQAIQDLYVEGARTQPDFVRFVHALVFSGLYNDIFDFHGYWKWNFRVVTDWVARAQRQGLVRADVPAETMARALTSLFQGNMQDVAFCPEMVTDPDLASNTLRILLEGAAPRGRAQRQDPKPARNNTARKPVRRRAPQERKA